MIMYRAQLGSITRFDDIVRKSDKYVFLSGGRRAAIKTSDGWSDYFDTYEEARNHLFKVATQKLHSAETHTAHLREELQKVMTMPKTEEPK